MPDLVDWTNNHIQQELRDTSVAAWELIENTYNKGIIPAKNSPRQTGTYWIYDKKYFMSTQVKERSPGTVTPVANYAVETATYHIPQYTLGIGVTNEEITEASDTLEPMMDAARFLSNNFIVDYELDFANTFVSDDVWAYQAEGQSGATTKPIDGNVSLDIGATGAAVFQQFDQLTTSDPIEVFKKVIRTIQRETGIKPNKMLIPRLVFDSLMDNDNIKQWAANTIGINGGDDQTKAIIATQLGFPLEGIHIVEMAYQDITSINYTNRDTQNHNFGQDSTPTFSDMEWVLERSILFMYSGASFSKYSKTAATCFKWTDLIESMQRTATGARAGNLGGVDSPNLLIRGRYDETNFTNYIEGYFAYKNNVITPTLGFYLKNCIADPDA